MRIPIAQLKPNPFRDFELYPIDPEQVDRLRQSIDSLGFFSGITVRPLKRDLYETAAGHHRIEAAKKAGLDYVEAVCEKYTDEQMVQIMTVENMTQRGHNAASTLDSVAAYCRLLSLQILINEGPVAKILAETPGGGALIQAQKSVAKDGPGKDVLYRAINGFSIADRAANKTAETITTTEITSSLEALRTSGHMAKIVSESLELANLIREEEDAKAKAETEAQAQAEAKAEIERQAKADAEAKALEEKRKAEANAEAEARRKAKEAAEANAAKKAEANKAAEAAAAEATRKREEREQAEKEQAETKKQAAADKAKFAAEAKRQAEIARKEIERRAAEAKAVKEQEALEAVYDIRCVNIFESTAQEGAFRKAVLSEMGKRVIAWAQQLPLARNIRGQIDDHTRDVGHTVGSATVTVLVNEVITKAMKAQRDIDEAEKREMLARDAIKRVENVWIELKRSMTNAHVALRKLSDEHANWSYDKALFPMDMESVRRIAEIGRLFNDAAKKLGIRV
jgi:hypothetical protein